jgi:hypothetical protein
VATAEGREIKSITIRDLAFTVLVLLFHSTGPDHRPVELERRAIAMSKNQRQTPRKPAIKFAHLQKKMQKQKVQAKKSKKK